MALSADVARSYDVSEDRLERTIPSDATKCYAGSVMGENSSTGYARPLTAGDTFLGFAIKGVDNSAGSQGDLNVDVYSRGTVELTITGCDNVNDLGVTVYADDDGTFTLTSSSNTAIGKIVEITSATNGTARVRFEAAGIQSI